MNELNLFCFIDWFESSYYQRGTNPWKNGKIFSISIIVVYSIPFRPERDGKSRTDMQTGARQPPIPPRVKFRGVSVCFGRFGEFRDVSAGMCISAGLLFGRN